MAHKVLRGPGVSDAAHYRRRVGRFALVQLALFACSIVGLVLLIWRGELLVTLSQRSNVETLTIAFFIVFFGYFAFITASGARGAVRIALFRLWARWGDRAQLEASRTRVLGARGAGTSVAFDKAIELEGTGGRSWEVALVDDDGTFGRLVFDGVRVEHADAFAHGSNTMFGYLEDRLAELTHTKLNIVHWESTGEEELLAYTATTEAIRALGRTLDAPCWPVARLSLEGCALLERDLATLVPALREEALLPDWEFEGEHKLPIIPEPLGIISLRRAERRVDPLSALTAALAIVVIVIALLVYFLVRPPWVPGR